MTTFIKLYILPSFQVSYNSSKLISVFLILYTILDMIHKSYRISLIPTDVLF